MIMFSLSDFYSYQEDGKTYLVIDEVEPIVRKPNTTKYIKEYLENKLEDLDNDRALKLTLSDLDFFTKEDMERYGGIRLVYDGIIQLHDEDEFKAYIDKFTLSNPVSRAMIKIILDTDFSDN